MQHTADLPSVGPCTASGFASSLRATFGLLLGVQRSWQAQVSHLQQVAGLVGPGRPEPAGHDRLQNGLQVARCHPRQLAWPPSLATWY